MVPEGDEFSVLMDWVPSMDFLKERRGRSMELCCVHCSHGGQSANIS